MLNTHNSLLRSGIQQDENNLLFQAILEVSEEAFFVLDKTNFNIIDCNLSALKLFEAQSKSQVVNLPSYKLYNFEPFEFSLDKLNEELDKKGEYSQELSFRTCKQNVFWGKLVQKNLGLGMSNYSVLKISKSANFLKNDEWLSDILKITSKSAGRQFFKEATKLLCSTFNAEYAFIARRIVGDDSKLKVFYFMGEGVNVTHIPLKNSFIENIMRGYTSYYPQKLQELFPNDQLLKDTKTNSFIGAPFFDASGQLLGLIGVLSINEMEEIPNSRYMLNILGSRTATEIQRIRSKEMLRQQTKELAEINHMKDRLLAVITNDLQAPLNTILGYSGMIRNKINDYNPEELSEKIRVMDNSLRNLYMLLENVTDWSKLQQSKVGGTLKKSNLRNILEDINPFIKYLGEIKNTAIINKVPAALNIMGDSYLSRATVKNVAAFVLKNLKKSGSFQFDSQLVNGKWLFIVKSAKHMADLKEINFVMNSTNEEFYMSSMDISTPALGLFISREFMRLQKGKLKSLCDEKKLEFHLEFLKG